MDKIIIVNCIIILFIGSLFVSTRKYKDYSIPICMIGVSLILVLLLLNFYGE